MRLLLALAIFLVALPAHAFTYGSAISVGCHERITTATLRQIRTELPNQAPPLAKSTDETAFVDDLPFGVEQDVQDLAGATLLVGVRDNDLKGRGPTELDELAFVHGNPNNQEEHCLRSASEDEPNGTTQAIAACRAFILGKMVAALDGLDANGVPDPTKRTDLDVALSIRGKVTANLPLFYVFMGQGLHAMQDSFAHDFRTADRMRITTTMNYVEYVDGDEVESRDGPLHRTGMDACDGVDDFRTNNIAVAQRASQDLLRTALNPALSHDQKVAAFDTVLDAYLTYEPGCTVDNHWCNAPEQNYEVARGCGCLAAGAPSASGLAVAAVALAAFLLRRRRAAVVPLVLAALALPRAARADEPPTAPVVTDPSTGMPAATDQGTPPPGVPTQSEVKAEQKEQAHERLFSVYAALSGSITNPSFNQQLGIRFRLTKLLSLGLDGELNNSFGVNNGKFRTLAANVYATGIFHYPIRFASVNLRTTVNIGTSTLLIDLYGAPSGTTGIYLGATPLGLEYKLSKRFYLVFDALGVSLPVPQLKGAPYGYVQYRTAAGAELSF